MDKWFEFLKNSDLFNYLLNSFLNDIGATNLETCPTFLFFIYAFIYFAMSFTNYMFCALN